MGPEHRFPPGPWLDSFYPPRGPDSLSSPRVIHPMDQLAITASPTNFHHLACCLPNIIPHPRSFSPQHRTRDPVEYFEDVQDEDVVLSHLAYLNLDFRRDEKSIRELVSRFKAPKLGRLQLTEVTSNDLISISSFISHSAGVVTTFSIVDPCNVNLTGEEERFGAHLANVVLRLPALRNLHIANMKYFELDVD